MKRIIFILLIVLLGVGCLKFDHVGKENNLQKDFQKSKNIIVSMGSKFSMIVKEDGTLWAIGDNYNGQFGNGAKGWLSHEYKPIPIIENVIFVSTGNSHTAIIKTDNTLWTVGANYNGQLGDGTKIDKSEFVKIMTDVKSVSTGNSDTFIIKNDNTLWVTGWGRIIPEKIMSNVKSVATGSGHVMIIKDDDTLWGMGENKNGELGDGSFEKKEQIVKIMDGVKFVRAGTYNSLIIKKDDSLWGTGWNFSGQLGDGTRINKSSPIKIMDEVIYATVGFKQSLLIKKDGTLWVVGDNEGNGYKPVKLFSEAKTVAGGDGNTLIIKKDGTLWGVGNNMFGELGTGDSKSVLVPTEIK